jgi:hypothetical protein
MRKLTQEEKEALKKKLKEEGIDEEGGQTEKKQLTDEEKEKMKKMIAQAERDRLGKLDKMLHSRSKKK